MPTLTLAVDEKDIRSIGDFLEGMGRRMSRQELLPIVKEGMEPLVRAEKGNLSGHVVSGALSMSLRARAGGGDRPGTMSVFSAPTATVKQLQRTWGKPGKGRKQQQKWAAGLSGSGRRKIFYGNIVHQGHAIVKRDAKGNFHVVGRAKPVPFAQQAIDALGEQQAEVTAEAVLKHIVGE